MAKVSVIVPVYNAEKTIMKAMKGILMQTLKDIEVILVDDCSTDASFSYCQAFAKEIPEKIRVLKTDANSGAGGARNLALDVASGEYIGFVDSDDEISPKMYELLYNAASKNDADIADAGYYNEEKDFARLHTDDSMCGDLDDVKRSALIISGGYIVTKIFRRELLEGIRFRNNATLEDSEFLNYAFANAQRITNVKEIVYKYCYYPTSFSRLDSLDKYFRNIYGAFEANYKVLHELPNYEGIREAVEYELLTFYSYGVNMCVKEYKDFKNPKSIEYLEKLAKLKKQTVKLGYENKYVKQKMDALDIDLMKRNDVSSQKLLRMV